MSFSRIGTLKNFLVDLKKLLDSEKKIRPFWTEDDIAITYSKIVEDTKYVEYELQENLATIKTLEARIAELEREALSRQTVTDECNSLRGLINRMNSFVGKIMYSESLLDKRLKNEASAILKLSRSLSPDGTAISNE